MLIVILLINPGTLAIVAWMIYRRTCRTVSVPCETRTRPGRAMNGLRTAGKRLNHSTRPALGQVCTSRAQRVLNWNESDAACLSWLPSRATVATVRSNPALKTARAFVARYAVRV